MKAVLYICHGTRVKAGAKQAADFIRRTMPLVEADIQEICYLELSEPSIEEGVKTCVDQGATEIIALPFLLLTAGHAKEDIPVELAKAAAAYPEITVRYGRPIGVHPKMVDVVIERMNRAANVQPNATVLLVGRGSSDPATKRDFSEILALFQEKTGLTDVHVAYMAACDPPFEEELTRLAALKPRQLFVLPYILFSGVLMKTMGRAIKELDTGGDVHLCAQIGYNETVSAIVAERVEEAMEAAVFHVSDYR